jgi:hypothetical protein
MWNRFWSKLFALILPFTSIAEEIKILRELYELDLASRKPPIYRVTESPGDDTEISFGDEKRVKKSALTLEDLDEDED